MKTFRVMKEVTETIEIYVEASTEEEARRIAESPESDEKWADGDWDGYKEEIILVEENS